MKKTNTTILALFVILAAVIIHPLPTKGQGTDQVIYLSQVFNAFDPDWRWDGIRTVDLKPVPASDPFVLVDQGGSVHIFWDTYSSQSPAFIYHIYQTEDGWTAPQAVANTLGRSELLFPPLITPNGYIHLLWYNRLVTGTYRLMYAYFDGSAWSAEEEIASFSQPFPEGRLNFDGEGIIHATYRVPELLTSSLYHRARTSSGWEAPQKITPNLPSFTTPIFNAWPDRDGGVRLYGDDIYNQVFFLYWKDNSFIGDVIKFNGEIGHHRTTLDSLHNLHIYWDGDVPVPGGTVTGLNHQCLDSSLQWSPLAALSGYDSTGYGSRAAWDGYQHMAFGWKQYGSMELDVVILTGCQETHRKTAVLPAQPGVNKWGNLASVGVSNQPGKFCALVEIPYQSSTFGLQCADIQW